jgi:hypothetical protein
MVVMPVDHGDIGRAFFERPRGFQAAEARADDHDMRLAHISILMVRSAAQRRVSNHEARTHPSRRSDASRPRSSG